MKRWRSGREFAETREDLQGFKETNWLTWKIAGSERGRILGHGRQEHLKVGASELLETWYRNALHEIRMASELGHGMVEIHSNEA